ncbi:phytanoyl-CoA dioxygenase family protein [Zavarzinia sp. CC-PAN008]|uniref:phytanoyl-CoA dioxygenase family protein n=1 Tax=Zavarzinia sp. CC-PAN008 TaxID=3243332 RepID=UPI003F7466D1
MDAASRPGLAPHIDWDAARTALAQDGVVFLQAALDGPAMAQVEEAFAWSLANPGPNARRFYPGEKATFLEDTGTPASRPRYLDLVRQAGVADTVARLWGTSTMWYMGEQLFLKEGGFSRRTPWHQDTSYLRMAGSQLVACWVSLDPLPRTQCLEFVRGSHRGPLYDGSAFDAKDDTAPLYGHGGLPRLPDIQAARQDYDILSWDVTPGDIIVFHLGTLHGGAGTTPEMRRRTMSLRFMGPDVVYDARPGDSQESTVGNDARLATAYAGLKPGDPFRTEMFAKV